jgi:hypothetical protein
MATQKFESAKVATKEVRDHALPVTTRVERQSYRSPELRQVGTLQQMQGCVCGTSCDCSGNYYNSR